MTVRDAFLAHLGHEAAASEVAVALLEAGLDGDAPYLPEMRAAVERAVVDPLWRHAAVLSEAEGGLSVSRSAREVRGRLLWLARRHGRRDIVRELEGAAGISDASRMR